MKELTFVAWQVLGMKQKKTTEGQRISRLAPSKELPSEAEDPHDTGTSHELISTKISPVLISFLHAPHVFPDSTNSVLFSPSLLAALLSSLANLVALHRSFQI